MTDNSPGLAKRFFFLALAVLFLAWAINTAIELISAVWWQLSIIAAVIVVIIVVFITLRNRWR